MRPRHVLTLAVLLVLCACDGLPRTASTSTPSSRGPGAPPAPAAVEPALQADTTREEVRLLRRHGWTPVQLLAEDTLRIPEPADLYLQTRRYLEASQMVGLDFSSRAGQTLRVRSYRVRGRSARGGSVSAHLLLSQAEVVGAWLSVDDRTPGIYPLSFDPYSL